MIASCQTSIWNFHDLLGTWSNKYVCCKHLLLHMHHPITMSQTKTTAVSTGAGFLASTVLTCTDSTGLPKRKQIIFYIIQFRSRFQEGEAYRLMRPRTIPSRWSMIIYQRYFSIWIWIFIYIYVYNNIYDMYMFTHLNRRHPGPPPEVRPWLDPKNKIEKNTVHLRRFDWMSTWFGSSHEGRKWVITMMIGFVP